MNTKTNRGLRTKIAALILAATMVLGLSVPAEATTRTTAYNTGSSTIYIRSMTGAWHPVYPGGRLSQAKEFKINPGQCYSVNGATECASIFGTGFYYIFGDGVYYVKRTK